MRKLVLHFVGETRVELFETLFSHPLAGSERRCIRGHRSGAYRAYSTFQWTKAVHALALLGVEAAIRAQEPAESPLLVGWRGSLASSLDYAIDKQTTWLTEMFGWDEHGTGLSRRLFLRSNPGQRISGRVALSLNRNFCDHHEVLILLNERHVIELDALKFLRTSLSPKGPSLFSPRALEDITTHLPL